MGLDMYLFQTHYIKEWDHDPDDERIKTTITKGGEPIKFAGRPFEVRYEVAYWRKANAVHQWFVENCQEGVDECQYSAPIAPEQIETLVQICKRVIDLADQGEWTKLRMYVQDHLPPTAGFFFGPSDIDDDEYMQSWFIEDMRNTVEQLTPLLDEDQIGTFTTGNGETKRYFKGDVQYHSSW